jgi:hypothetical protein
MATGSVEFEKIFIEASEAARKAVEDIVKVRPENHFAFDCGFAWVVIRPGTSPFVCWLRKQIREAQKGITDGREKRLAKQNAEVKYGHKHYYGGWQIWQPGGWYGQSIHIHEAGAKAFAEVLVKHGIEAFADSRLD